VGPDHPDALESLHALGQVLYGADDESRARNLLQESLDRHRRVYGDEHEKTARAMFALAPLLAGADLDAAGALLAQALEVRRRVLPPNHPDLATSFGALAQYHRQRGDLERSRELYRQAFAVFQNARERQHPKAIRLMSDYASLLENMNAHAEAEAIQRETIAVGLEVLGPGTLTVANLINNHATTLALLGRHADAEAAFRQAFDQHVALLGENHWRIVNLARNVGRILDLQGRHDEALPWMDRALAIRRNPSLDGDTAIEGIRAQRAWILFRLGRRGEALDQATAAVSALERMKDSTAGYVLALSRSLLARILNALGRPEKAEPAARAAIAWFERYGSAHPKYADAECQLGRAQVLQGQTAEGRTALERCLPIYRAWGLADRDDVASIERVLAEAARP
jgi:tetratricopeptide (TPR) repeat protein